MDRRPGAGRGLAASVERAGREALAEMRRLLGVLDDGQDPRALAPQPGLADIQDLLAARAHLAWPPICIVDGEPAMLPPALDLCAYRIVQEALTNAIKHAAPARAEVCVRWGQDALELEISTTAAAPAQSTAPRAGMGSPACASARRCTAAASTPGAGPDGGFTVRAHLPLAAGAVR